MYRNKSVNEDLQRIMSLVEFISQEHIMFTHRFLDAQEQTPSLKTKRLRHFLQGSTEDNNIEIEIEFLSYILNYLDDLGEFYTFELLMRILEEDIPYDHIREKNKDSIISKIFHYRFGKTESGQLSTNKCLNDLLGFRIYIDTINDYSSFTEELRQIIGTKDKRNNRLKFHNSCKGDYKAVHIYFNGIDNKYFPWELQIWDRHYAENNLHSHKNHKLGYLEWKNFAADDIIEIIER